MCGTTCFTFLLRVGDPFFFQSEILTWTTKNCGKHIFLSSSTASLFFFVAVLVVAIKVTRRRQIIKTSNKRSSVFLQCLFVHRYHHPSVRRYEAVKITLRTREDVRLHIKKHHRRGTEEKR